LKDFSKIKKYANGLIKVSNENNIGNLIKELTSFKKALKEFPKLRHLLSSKRISIDNKIKSIRHIFNQYYNVITIEFISLIIENNDTSIYNDILDKVIGLTESNSSIKKIHVTSHQEYSEQNQAEILSVLKNKFNISDSSNTFFDVDSEILGGIKIRIGNKIIDGSVSTKLKKIKQSLLGI